MILNVNPAEVAAAVSKLAALVQATQQSLPQSWVLPAGADPISTEHAPRLNGRAADLFNKANGVMHAAHHTTYNAGAAASDYTSTDDEGSRLVGGSGGEVLPNPVGEPPPPMVRQPPVFSVPAGGPAVDPLTLAEQLRAGPGPGPAAAFASNVRDYLASSHLALLDGLDQAAQTMRNWTPVGTAAADELNQHRSMLDELGSMLSDLADGADNYGDAFAAAKAQHPTPEEIIAARQELLSAIRSKNQLGVDDALAKFQEQNARSAESFTGYATQVNGKSGTGESTSGSGSSNGSGGDTSALTLMLPLLTSAMSSGAAGQTSANQDSTDSLGNLDNAIGGLGGDGGGYGGGIDPGVSVPSAADVADAGNATSIVGPMPLASSVAGLTASMTSAMSAAPVAESLQSATGAAVARPGGAGSPYMPMMPMSPGMAGAGGGNNERNRVVAWHPDRLMYVDDTPHTEQVIGEKPTIAPSVTPPTPSQNSTPAGGSA